MPLFKIIVRAVIFITRFRFPLGSSIATNCSKLIVFCFVFFCFFQVMAGHPMAIQHT